MTTHFDRLGEVLDALTACSEFLDNYVDVVDGDDGEPRPNRAMSLNTVIECAIVQTLIMRALLPPNNAEVE